MKKNLLLISLLFFALKFNAQNIIDNGGFDDGKGDWVTWGSDNNVLQSFDVVDESSNNVAKLVIANASGEIKNGTLKQKNAFSGLDSSLVYHLSVRAKALKVADGETAQMQFKTKRLKDGANAKYINLDTYELTTEWKKYDAYFYKEDSWNELLPSWNFGAVNGDYYFDDFVLEVNKNIANGNFESDFESTWFKREDNGTVEISNNSVYEGGSAAKVTINTAGDAWHLKLGTKLKIPVDENTDYSLSYYSKSDNGNGKIKLAIDFIDSKGDKIGKTKYVEYTTTTSYEEYNTEFTTPTGTKKILVTFMLAEVVDVIYIDNVNLSKNVATAIRKRPEDNSVKIYPNPANDFITIAGNSNIASVEVSDMTGCRVLKNANVNGRVDISSLKTGVYLLKVTTEKGTKVTKLIKQ